RLRRSRPRPDPGGAGRARRRRPLQPAGRVLVLGRRAAEAAREYADVMHFRDVVSSDEELATLYGPPVEAVTNKIIDHPDGPCRVFTARARFVPVAPADEQGNCDVSPKGGVPGFVQVLDDRLLAIPDAPGNKLVYSLRNVFRTSRAGLLFLIPGLEE